jgi:uncharacterized protein (TIGR00297 family)
VVLGVVAAAMVAALARRARALSRSGTVAATGVGGALIAGAGWRAGVALVGFFVSATLLGRMPTRRGIEQRRGNERDAVQVVANGGVAATLGMLSALAPRRLRPLLRAGVYGAIAAAAADTWATEIGSRSRQRPRSIATGRRVAPGASGGVTAAGVAASVAGAAAIAKLASVGSAGGDGDWPVRWLPVTLAGVTGSLCDSLLGATVQEVRFCPACARETELTIHRCGTRTTRLRGAPWCDNDAVNALATAAGSMTAVMLTARRGRSAWRREVGDASPAAVFDNPMACKSRVSVWRRSSPDMGAGRRSPVGGEPPPARESRGQAMSARHRTPGGSR